MFADLWRNRRLILRLSVNDFKTRYAGSLMGIFWAFVQPVITVLVYWFVFEKGLRAGDLVDVFNQRGCIKKMKLHLREDIRPGMAHVWYSFDEKYYPDNDNPQVLENPINTKESMTDFSYTWGVEQKRRELASGAPISSLFILEPVTNEVFWDARCDVRKAGN